MCNLFACLYKKSRHNKSTPTTLQEYAQRCGYEVVEVYEDKGVSGVKNSRPSLDKMVLDARRRRFSMILSWSINRVGRNMTHLCSFVNELNQLGVNLYFHQSSIDTTTSVGKMFFHIISSVASFERELIRESVIAGLERAKSNGVVLGRPTQMNEGMKSAIKILNKKVSVSGKLVGNLVLVVRLTIR